MEPMEMDKRGRRRVGGADRTAGGTWPILAPIPDSWRLNGSATGIDGDELRSHQWYRQAKETKRGEMGSRESYPASQRR
jgi:hypothetical protein